MRQLGGGLLLAAGLAAAATAEAYVSGPPLDHVRILWPMEAPRECTNCHTGFVNGHPGDLTVTGLPVAYEAGVRYPLTVTLDDPDAARQRWGFQLAAIRDDFGQAGSLAPIDATVNVLTDPGRMVEFIRQTLGGSGQAAWAIDWTAPAAGSGDVSFYYCGNAGNGAGSDGDHIFCRNETVPEAGCAAVPGAIVRLRGVRVGADIEWSWDVDLAAEGGYRLYAVATPDEIAAANESTPSARRDCPAPLVTDRSCLELDAMVDPDLRFYQVVGVCSSGLEGPN